MSNYESKPPRIGLWANERGPMASGNCGALRFVLWDNRDRKQGNGPDYQLVIEQAQPRERTNERVGQRDVGGGSFPDDEIPF